jgi:protein O-mannosyl-transferase
MVGSQQNARLHLLLISVVVVAVFANTLNHGFVWDDLSVIAHNRLLESLGNIPKFFLLEDVADGSTGYYRPITYASFALDHAIWGSNPIGYSITNLLLHVLVALLFYRVVAALFRKENLALIAALIFSLHPITVETVNFHAGGRNTLLSACFGLLSLLCYVRGRKVAAVVWFALGIFSKEFALLLPALFLLYDLTIDRDNGEKIRWSGYLPYPIVIACYLFLRSAAVATNGNLLQAVNIVDNFWIVPQTVISYLKVMIFPAAIKTMYDMNNQVTWTSFFLNTFLVLALVALAVIFRKRREILFGVVMFLLFLMPVSNILPLGTAMLADRYAYFALFGFSLAAAYLITLPGRRAALGIVAGIAILFAIIDVRQNTVWKDEVSLFSRMIKDAPEMCVGYQNLGYAYYDKEDIPQAQKYLSLAQSKKDLNMKTLTSAALTLMELERPDLALNALNKAIELEPNSPEGYAIASRVCDEIHNEQLAKWYRDRATALAPGLLEGLQQRAASACKKAEAQVAQGDYRRAERLYYGALGYNLLYVPAVTGMGTVAAKNGNRYKSMYYFRKATKLDPADPFPQYQLALALEGMGHKDQAQQAMSRFRDLDAAQRKVSGAGQ